MKTVLLTGIFLIFLGAFGIGSIANTYSANPKSSTSSLQDKVINASNTSMKNYYSEVYGFTVKYPDDWWVDESLEGSQVTITDGNILWILSTGQNIPLTDRDLKITGWCVSSVIDSRQEPVVNPSIPKGIICDQNESSIIQIQYLANNNSLLSDEVLAQLNRITSTVVVMEETK